ncbi:hypothetical protein [Actibacterium sp. D379-3]
MRADPHRTITPCIELIWMIAIFLVFACAPVLPALADALASPFSLVQDDGRHFVVWLRRLADPGLFPNDPIADYFHNLTPQTYRLLAWPAVPLGIDMELWHLFVLTPLAVGTFLWAANRFVALVVPDAVTRVIVVTYMMLAVFRDVPLGLPRSFREAIVLGALALFLRGRTLPLIVVMGVGANLYPASAAVVGVTMLVASLWRWGAARRADRAEVLRLFVAAAASFAGLGLFLWQAGDAGATVTLTEAREMPIFGPGGRTMFFSGDDLAVILCNRRGGLLPFCIKDAGAITLALTVAGLVVGWLALRRLAPQSDATASRGRQALVALVAVGIVLALLAWTVAFKAHLPSRYRIVSLDIVWNMGAGAIVAVLATLATRYLGRWLPAVPPALILLTGTVDRPSERQLILDETPAISAFLRSTPKDTLTAGLPESGASIPAFATRSIWVTPELTVPYKMGYYRLMEQRAETLFRLLGGPVDETWQVLLTESGIDYMLVYRGPAMSKRALEMRLAWLGTFPVARVFFGGGASIRETVFDMELAATSECTVIAEAGIALVGMACFADKALVPD